MPKAIVILGIAFLTSFAVHAQNSLCRIDLSGVTAALTRAQAAAARGEPDEALALIAQADRALSIIETRCNLPTVASEVELEQTFVATDGSFSVSYPSGWTVSPAGVPTSISIGTDSEAATALQSATPNLNAGQRGVLVVFGTPATLTANQSPSPNLEGVIRYLQAQLASMYLVRDSPQFFLLDNRLAAQFDFTSDGFDGMMIVVELVENRQYTVVAGAAAKGELEDFRPTIVSIAASVTQEG
jgi:hypothetical protein